MPVGAIVESGLKLLAAVFGYLAARGIDSIIGRYLAMIVIAFEKGASAQAMERFRTTRLEVAEQMAGKYDDWRKWREGARGAP